MRYFSSISFIFFLRLKITSLFDKKNQLLSGYQEPKIIKTSLSCYFQFLDLGPNQNKSSLRSQGENLCVLFSVIGMR
jgi:hypothetical protein